MAGYINFEEAGCFVSPVKKEPVHVKVDFTESPDAKIPDEEDVERKPKKAKKLQPDIALKIV